MEIILSMRRMPIHPGMHFSFCVVSHVLIVEFRIHGQKTITKYQTVNRYFQADKGIYDLNRELDLFEKI